MRPPPRARRWLPLLLLALVAAPAAGQMVLVHKVPVGAAATALGASDNATLMAVSAADGVSFAQSGYPGGKRPVPGIAAFVLAPDGSRSFAGTQAGEVIALDDRGVQQWSFRAGAPVTSLSSTWDHRILYTAGDTVGLLDSGGKEVRKRALPGLKSGSVSLGAGTVLTVGEGAVLALDPATLETRWQVSLLGIAEANAWEAGGAAIGSDGNLYRLDDSGRFLQIRAIPGPGRVVVSPDGRRIAVAGGNEVALFDENLRKVGGQGLADPLALAFSPEGNFLAVAARDKTVYLFGLSDLYPAGPVKIESQPPGAVITVDGGYRGVTPAEIPLERGSHRVEVIREGYETHRTTLDVAAGGEKVEAALVASATAPTAAPLAAPEEGDGGGLVLILLLAAGGAVAVFVLRRKKAGPPSTPFSPAPAPLPPPISSAPPSPPPPSRPPTLAFRNAPPPSGGAHANALEGRSQSETGLGRGPPPDLPPGTSAIVKERRPGYAYGLFRALVASGVPGLAVTRRDPRLVREEVPGAEVYWLSSMPGERNLRPVDLELLLSAAEGYFAKAEGAVVFLEGLEYLRLHRGFTPVLKLITHLQERAASRKGRLLIAVGAGTLDPHETALLKGEGRARDIEEPPGRPSPPAEVTAGAVYLLLEKGPEGAYRRLKEWGSRGRKTLAVSRSSPEEARQRYSLGPETRVAWLTTSKGADRMDPSDLELLLKMLRDFLEEGEDRAILLEGVDHIAAIASFGAVQKFLGHLVDLCVARRAVALVPIDPYALELAKVTYLGRELVLLEGK